MGRAACNAVVISILLVSFLVSTWVRAETLNIYAAASLTDVVDDLIIAFEDTNDVDAQGIYASSAALVRQINAGAPAHIFISAHPAWMDDVEAANAIVPASRQIVAANRLVTIAHQDKDMSVPISAQKDMRVVIGEPTSIPVGIYALQAMKTMGDYAHVKDNLIFADNARAVLTWIERSEADFGIVYATDALISDQVKVVATFPDHAHDPIFYPAAKTIVSHAQSDAFLSFLSSAQGQTIFTKHGFAPVSDHPPLTDEPLSVPQ